MSSKMSQTFKFKELLIEPVRNGIYKPKEFHGRGCKIVNMGELFAFPRLNNVPMKRVELTTKEMNKSLLEPGDLLFARRSLVASGAGKCSIVREVTEPTTFESSIIRARPNPQIACSDYLYYFFSSPFGREQMGTILRQVAVSGITGSDLMELDIYCPAISIQKEIATLFNTLDDRIALLRETNATLEAIAQALFKSWFVDFDPVHAKARGEPPQGMDDATAALFPDSFEESELGMIPKGWRVGTVSELGNVICGKTPPTSDPENYGDAVPFITIPDMHGLLAITSTSRALSIKGANSQTKKYLPAGSICVSCIATPGLVVQVTEPSQTNQQINSVVPFDKWGNSFPLFLLRRIGDKVRSGGSGGSVFHNLSKSGFERIQELLPDQLIANCFNQVVDPLVSKIIENQRQAQTLAQLRDTLLPKLISGQLRLPEAETLLAEELP